MSAATAVAPNPPAPAAADPASLRDVIARIPQSCYERSTARGLLLVARDIAREAER